MWDTPSRIGWLGDCAVQSQKGFQDPATTTMEGIFLFNLHLLFVIICIVLLVGWLLVVVISNFTELDNSQIAKFSHSNTIEIVWTSIPALILLSLASPSFSLLYSLDEISNPELTLKILGHQCTPISAKIQRIVDTLLVVLRHRHSKNDSVATVTWTPAPHSSTQ